MLAIDETCFAVFFVLIYEKYNLTARKNVKLDEVVHLSTELNKQKKIKLQTPYLR